MLTSKYVYFSALIFPVFWVTLTAAMFFIWQRIQRRLDKLQALGCAIKLKKSHRNRYYITKFIFFREYIHYNDIELRTLGDAYLLMTLMAFALSFCLYVVTNGDGASVNFQLR
jgi:hypothetical protein